MRFRSTVVVALLALLVAAALAGNTGLPANRTKNGVIVGPLNDGAYVEIAIARSATFRLSVSYSRNFTGAIPSNMIGIVDESTLPNNYIMQSGNYIGLGVDQVGFMGVTADGGFILTDFTKNTIVSSDSFIKPLNAAPTSAPKLTSLGDADVSPFANSTAVQFTFAAGDGARFYASGADHDDALVLHRTSGYAFVENRGFGVPYYWTTDGYGLLAVARSEFVLDYLERYPVRWEVTQDGEDVRGPRLVRWYVGDQMITAGYPNMPPRRQADLYFIIAREPRKSLPGLYELTGYPQVAPLYAHGFLASRWGWSDNKYIEDVLQNFRKGNYPLDAFIMDFEWYTPVTDYDFPDEGKPDFVDFGYNKITFPEPVEQLDHYHNGYNVRFAGIRKPRLGNSDLLTQLRHKGWLIGGSRQLNFSLPEVRTWYAQQLRHFIQEGVDFWWNDEGETQYFTFERWNQAELELLRSYPDTAERRLFTINRAYTPGVQSIGATATWTGDIFESWDDLQKTPGYFLNWHMAGAFYITCDIGGFEGEGFLDASPELVTRWYQTGVFMPLMRVHSCIDRQPHFPFLYPEEYANAMRAAMDLRYRFIPTIYSLIHESAANGEPLLRPFYVEFPEDSDAREITSEWMFGPSILSAPVLKEGGGDTHTVYLPNLPSLSGTAWYEFDTSNTFPAGTTISYPTPMNKLPVFIRSGTILFLASSGLQTTEQLPGGPLEIQIYDNTGSSVLPVATLVEDDGASIRYETTPKTVRRIQFTWTSPDHTLSWQMISQPAKEEHHWFKNFFVKLFTQGHVIESQVYDLTPSGKIVVAEPGRLPQHF